MGVILSLSLAFALEEVAQYKGSLDVGKEGGVVYIGPGVGPAAFCGNNFIDNGEQCDETNLNMQNCASLLGANYTGTLSCKIGCIFDTNKCSLTTNNGGNNGGNNNQGGGGGGGSFIVTENKSSPNKAVGCIEDWGCSDWSECFVGGQTRTCTDKNSCGTTFLKPALERLCEEKGIFTNNENSIGALLGAVIGTGKNAIINIGLIIFFFIAVIAIIIILSATKKKDVPVEKVSEVISEGKNNKVLNREKGDKVKNIK